MNLDFINSVDDLLSNSHDFLVEQETKAETKEKIRVQLEAIQKELKESGRTLDDMLRAAAILGTVSDENTQSLLNKITDMINESLDIIFSKDRRHISIKQVMYRNVYPHFVVELETADGVKRSFKQSGTGLAQVISFLFTVFLIDIRLARRVIVMDELLNGLHPDAKILIKEIVSVLSARFQFVIVEYGVDVGKQYEVVKSDSVATVTEYQGEGYYKDLNFRD